MSTERTSETNLSNQQLNKKYGGYYTGAQPVFKDGKFVTWRHPSSDLDIKVYGEKANVLSCQAMNECVKNEWEKYSASPATLDDYKKAHHKLTLSAEINQSIFNSIKSMSLQQRGSFMTTIMQGAVTPYRIQAQCANTVIESGACN